MMKPQPLDSWQVRTPALTPAACGCAPNARTPTAATAATIANRDILAIKLSLQFLFGTPGRHDLGAGCHRLAPSGHPPAPQGNTNQSPREAPWRPVADADRPTLRPGLPHGGNDERGRVRR